MSKQIQSENPTLRIPEGTTDQGERSGGIACPMSSVAQGDCGEFVQKKPLRREVGRLNSGTVPGGSRRTHGPLDKRDGPGL